MQRTEASASARRKASNSASISSWLKALAFGRFSVSVRTPPFCSDSREASPGMVTPADERSELMWERAGRPGGCKSGRGIEAVFVGVVVVVDVEEELHPQALRRRPDPQGEHVALFRLRPAGGKDLGLLGRGGHVAELEVDGQAFAPGAGAALSQRRPVEGGPAG